MTIAFWQAGTLYAPGAVVQPVNMPTPVNTAIVNPGFESGDSGWTKDAGWTIVNGESAFTGTWSARFDLTGSGRIYAAAGIAVSPGKTITARCQFDQGGSSAGELGARAILRWYDSGAVFISESAGTLISSGSDGTFQQLSVTGTAPALAAFVAIGAYAERSGGSDPAWVDAFTWDYVAAPTTLGLIFKAVQAAVGSSGATEPTWPTSVGLTVVDNEVTWEAIAGTRVEWTAYQILVSGPTEPAWPLLPGGTVADGSIIWRATSRRVEDENCPNTTVVAIMASHVFAVDEDIVRFSAAINPLDWTSESDAGFLATGLQQANANDMAVLATYRGNLIPMNASSLQNWQVDPDPELMALIDQIDGIGSTYPKTAVAVADDMLYLTALGVRSIGVAGASRNLSAGDIGLPVDSLIRDAIADALDNGIVPHAYYYPSLGQYLLAFPNEGGGGWVDIDQSGYDYTFATYLDEGNSVMTGAIVTGSTDGPADGSQPRWTVYVNGIEESLNVRVVRNNYTVTGNGAADLGPARIEIGSDSVENTTPIVGGDYLDFTPSTVEGTLDGESNAIDYFGTTWTPEEGVPDESFSFTIQVQLPGSPASTEVFVHTRTKGKAGSWSRYTFPFAITEFGLRANDLYFRQGDTISVFDRAVAYDEVEVEGERVAFTGFVQWNYLDCGQPGSTKQMQGFDFIGTGQPSFSIGWDERFPARFTTPYAIDPDTLVGGIIPLDVWGPSLSMRVDFAADEEWAPLTPSDTPWSLSSVLLYVNDMGNGP